ncbi:hypothetical protein [Soonwooa purpurea]
MKIVNFLKANAMLVVALLTVTTTMSFKLADSKRFDTVYYYQSSDISEGAFANTSHWNTTMASCATLGNRPCKVVVPTGSNLNAVIGGKTNAQVLAINPSERRP